MHALTHVAAVEATCTEPGSLEYWTCSDCGKKFADEEATEELSSIVLPAKGHTPGEAATCTEPQFCTVCNAVLVPAKGHTPGKAATCTEPQTCTVCGEVISPAKGHTPGEAATCTEPQTCTVCNEVISPAKGHTEVVDQAVPATCTEDGLTEGKHCSVCNEVLVKQEVVEATGHTSGEPVRENEKEAKCEEAGSYEEVVYCTVCKTELSRETKSIPQTGHHYENGYCVDCGEKELIPSEGLEFALLSNSYAVTGIGTCTDTDLVIPSVYNGLPVTVISDYAFADCDSLTSIDIPDGVTSIGEYAFADCGSLTSIVIPDSVTSIGLVAFANCNSLTSITVSRGNPVYHSAGNCIIETSSGTLIAGCKNSVIPNDGSVTSIGMGAFMYCYSLTSVTIPDGVTSIGMGAFASCTGLTSIDIPDSVTSIREGAFAYCDRLADVTIGDGVASVGEEAFAYCQSLSNVTIGSGVQSVGVDAFLDCYNLTAVRTNDIGAWCEIEFAMPFSNPKVYAPNFYVDGEILTDLVIPDGVKRIGTYALLGCTELKSVVIPDSVTSIGEFAFYGCESLASVVIGDGVTSIGEGTFMDCVKLASVTIGDGVTSIGEAVFGNTAFFADKNNWEAGALYSGKYLLHVDQELSGDYAIKDGTVLMADVAFYWCSNLTSITILESMTSISEGGFEYCASLVKIAIPDSVTSIGSGAFYGCSSLSSITIPDGVTNIGNGTFLNCADLTSITIPDGVMSFGDSAFHGCDSLTSIVIPDSVTSIGFQAFDDCDSLTTVYYNGTEEQWSAIEGLPDADIPAGATICFYSESEPSDAAGNYWHYDENGVPVIW